MGLWTEIVKLMPKTPDEAEHRARVADAGAGVERLCTEARGAPPQRDGSPRPPALATQKGCALRRPHAEVPPPRRVARASPQA